MAETSPLRRRMIEDMTVRNLSPATQQSYVHAVAKFSRFFGRSPDIPIHLCRSEFQHAVEEKQGGHGKGCEAFKGTNPWRVKSCRHLQ